VGTIERWQETIKRRKNRPYWLVDFMLKEVELEIHNPKILFLTGTAVNS